MSRSLSPTTVTPLRSLTTDASGTVSTTHGILYPRGGDHVLVEPAADAPGDALPVAIATTIPESTSLGDGPRYVIAEGLFQPDPVVGTVFAFGAGQFAAGTVDVYDGEETSNPEDSPSKISTELTTVLNEHVEPVPRQFVVEVLVERGYDRDRSGTVIDRLAADTRLYTPEPGLIGGL